VQIGFHQKNSLPEVNILYSKTY